MKKYILFCVAIISCLLLNSCGLSREATCNLNQNQTSVVLNQANYKIVKTVEGESSQLYFLCIGGLDKKSLKESAMSQMIKNADLTGSQAIINTNVYYQTQHYIVANQIRAIATGTVIEFTE